MFFYTKDLQLDQKMKKHCGNQVQLYCILGSFWIEKGGGRQRNELKLGQVI